MRKLLILFTILMLSLPTFSQTGKDAEIWARVDALTNSVFGTKDSTAIANLVGKKLTYGHSGGNIENRATMIHNASISPTVYKNTSTERIGITFIKKTAIVRYIFRATSIDKGVETPLNLGLLQVWMKEGGNWKLQARQAVKVNPK